MIFILDNYDSFTYNLYQYFGELGEEVVVYRPDECDIPGIKALKPDLIVISPGPCSPNEAVFSIEVINYFKGRIPILGICLGHQAIGQVFGSEVIRAVRPVHGKISLITHDGQGVFKDLPNPLQITRYHSLVVQKELLPEEFAITAQSEEGEVMAMRHKSLPIESVQFHPEAILTVQGHKLLANAVKQARDWLNKNGKDKEVWMVKAVKIEAEPDELLSVLRHEDSPFFLDSGFGCELGQYSYLGANPFLRVSAYQEFMVINTYHDGGNNEKYAPGENALSGLDKFVSSYTTIRSGPFPFSGGAVGFFSYDLKNEIEHLADRHKADEGIPLWRLAWYDGIIVYHHETRQYWLTACGMNAQGDCDPEIAEARIAKLWDIITQSGYGTQKSSDEPLSESEPLSDIDNKHLIMDVQSASDCVNNSVSDLAHNSESELAGTNLLPYEQVIKDVPKKQYLSDLQKVINYIHAGDIYQANLSQRLSVCYAGDPYELYLRLRTSNPAPFGAFLPYPDFQVLSASPERFIKITPDLKIETRPIKGTRPRGKTEEEDQRLAEELQDSAKEKAELTMIVDLERNDLGRICKFGTVKTTRLMSLEKYPSVWHLVATVEGQLKSALKPSQLLRAIFPGGSITGAPKIRAMEIIDEIEPYQRGIYTGSIGYIGFDGAWDLNIVIRTIVLKQGIAHIHAGGGVVADSIPLREYEETIHKARKSLEVLDVDLHGVIR